LPFFIEIEKHLENLLKEFRCNAFYSDIKYLCKLKSSLSAQHTQVHTPVWHGYHLLQLRTIKVYM